MEQNAKQALNQLDIIKSPLIVANYNNWATSEEYRESLFLKIKNIVGFPYPYHDFSNTIPNIGGGSSFDGMKYQYKAKDMKVLERYKDPSVQDAIQQIPERLKLLNSRLFEMD